MKLLPSIILSLLLITGLTSCSTLIPKDVELFQKKVPAYPVQTASALEKQREAAALAAQRAQQAAEAASKYSAIDQVTAPAVDAALLARALSDSLGPPDSTWNQNAASVAGNLDSAVVSHNKALAKYAKWIDKYAGLKIEGTGIDIPYFAWTGGILFLLFLGYIALKIGWTALKAYGNTNPLVAVGTSGVSLLASELSKGFTQIVQGGEAFKTAIEKQFGSGSTVANQVLALFTANHVAAQDTNIQAAVQAVTAPQTPAPVTTTAIAPVAT